MTVVFGGDAPASRRIERRGRRHNRQDVGKFDYFGVAAVFETSVASDVYLAFVGRARNHSGLRTRAADGLVRQSRIEKQPKHLEHTTGKRSTGRGKNKTTTVRNNTWR